MEMLLELLDTSVYGDLRVRHLLQVAIAFVVLRAAWRLMRPAKSVTAGNAVSAACGCGWRGLASRHAPRCPRCGNPAVLQ